MLFPAAGKPIKMTQVKDMIEQFASNDGKIDEKEFNDCVAIAKKASQGKRNDIQLKRMVIEVIQDNAFKTKSGWLSDWYARTKKELGMA